MDTSPTVVAMMSARYREMTPEARLEAAASLFESARAIVDSSLPRGLALTERRLAWAKRFYGSELPDAALRAYANYPAR